MGKPFWSGSLRISDGLTWMVVEISEAFNREFPHSCRTVKGWCKARKHGGIKAVI